MSTITIGDRVGASIPQHLSQRQLAPAVGMTHDALSRAIRGQRHFSALEIASLAQHLGADMQWLITGQEDPFKVRLAARHVWGQTEQGSTDQRATDDVLIARVVEAYRDAYEASGPTPSVPLDPDPAAMRERLLGDSVRSLAEHIERDLGVDVIRHPDLRTDYSLRIGSHAVILLRSTTNWFRANWSLAHELGHLALGHHVGERASKADEAPADAYASEMLLPADQLAHLDYPNASSVDLARLIWSAGVSTKALAWRLRQLAIPQPDWMVEALAQPTQRFLRQHIDRLEQPDYPLSKAIGSEDSLFFAPRDPINDREGASAGRSFPKHLLAALTERVEAGTADPYLLAWMRDVPVDELDWPEPDIEGVSDEYEAAISRRPRAAEWSSIISAAR